MKPSKQKILTILMGISLAISLGYIAFNEYSNALQAEQLNVFQQGAQYGYEQAVIQLVEQALTCQQVPVNIGNQSINMIAVECLQQAA